MSLGHASSQNHKAQLANAYNELGKELSSKKIKVVGNYNLGKVIGEGAYGKVRMGTHRITSARVAIKQIPKAMSASLTREIHHHRQLHHPHVMQMYEVIATESSIWIVTELCAGGELYDFLAEKGRLSEDETRIFFGQLCLAVAYLHEKGIVHRDLKLENVLLDERCRIKLGDFGFTREYERGGYLETFCGTTGYAAPEMLQSKRYTGPEVDVWSLGVIFYCLLTGVLPFDDDEETVMKDMIIKGEFENPTWLSDDARDIIRNVLLIDSAKRMTIAQILSHSWFTSPHPHINLERRPASSISNASPYPHSRRSSLQKDEMILSDKFDASSSSRTSLDEDTFPSVVTASPPTTPDHREPPHPFKEPDTPSMAHSNSSGSTLHTTSTLKTAVHKRATSVIEEEHDTDEATPKRLPAHVSGATKAPPYPVRTPARTKRRSVSSALSDPDSPISEAPLTPLPPQDFTSLLKNPAPVIFSTPLERELLNNLSSIGFDTGQIVHSVLSNACDAAGALWWMLKRKAENAAFEETHAKGMAGIAETDGELDVEEEREKSRKKLTARASRSAGTQTDPESRLPRHLAISAPQFSFIPPTPTVLSSPRLELSTHNPPLPQPLLSPSISTSDFIPRSAPNTPSRDGDSSAKGSRAGKQRSGSVSIIQRAATALEAAGLVRKKSAENVLTQRDAGVVTCDISRSSHGGSSSRLVHSPSLGKLHDGRPPSTPSLESREAPIPAAIGSPWVVTDSDAAPTQDCNPADRDTLTSLPDFSSSRGGKTMGLRRSRASILSTLRIWFNEDRKGKRKAMALPSVSTAPHESSFTVINPSIRHGRVGSAPYRSGRGNSRRRSSSANSHRSSGASFRMHHGVAESPNSLVELNANRQSFGARTPTSDRGDKSSRPSSVHSTRKARHRKSPSVGSMGSYRAASPYHRRQGSESSTTRVIRKTQRTNHVRSGSTASSIHSVASSRPASYYELSETEGSRTGSPFRAPKSRVEPHSRRANGFGTTFIAHKRQTPFGSPGTFHTHSMGRYSWKKSWGIEPPGWQNRAAFVPVEVLAISPGGPEGSLGLRDVFAGRMSMGDDSDWVDEDDDIPAFAGGLGQNAASASLPQSLFLDEMSPSPSQAVVTSQTRRSKTGRRHGTVTASAPVGRQSRTPINLSDKSSIPQESFNGDDNRSSNRWQGQEGRNGLASRSKPNPIQEEDEEVEDD